MHPAELIEVADGELFWRQLGNVPSSPAAHELVELGAPDPQLAAGVQRLQLAPVEPPPDRPRRHLGILRRFGGRQQLVNGRPLGERRGDLGGDFGLDELADRDRQRRNSIGPRASAAATGR
jgi:hypothetical protein